MASIKVKLRVSSIYGKEGTVYYQIIHQRIVKQISTTYHIKSDEWDSRNDCPIIAGSPERMDELRQLSEDIRHDRNRLIRIITKLDRRYMPYTTAEVVNEYHKCVTEYMLFVFIRSIISQLKKNGRIRTSETYQSTLNCFKEYRSHKDLPLDCLTSEIIEEFESYLHTKGLSPNTTSFYMRVLRAVYNRAVEQGIVDQSFPFWHVYTGIGKTVKRALPIHVIKLIRRMDLSATPVVDYARDMFMLSFIFRGMSFIDMAYLQKSDLRNGHLTYRRRKTGQLLMIKWTSEMQSILDKYPKNQSRYLLPIITKSGEHDRSVYRNMSHYINLNLKQLAKMAGITIPLTLYVARHSWASAAKSKGIPISIISEGMGHDSESTTQIYLSSLDTSAIDKANSLILKSI